MLAMMLNRNNPSYAWPVYDWSKKFSIDDRFTDWWIEDVGWTYIENWRMTGPWSISKLQNSPMENMQITAKDCTSFYWNGIPCFSSVRIESDLDPSQVIEMVAKQILNNYFYSQIKCYINWVNVYTFTSDSGNIYSTSYWQYSLRLTKTRNSVEFYWILDNGSRSFTYVHSFSFPLSNKYSYTQIKQWVAIPSVDEIIYKNPYPV